MKILIFLLCLLFATPSYAGMVIGSGAAAPPSGLCTACTGMADADIFCEDWEDADYKWCTWDETNIQAGTTVTYNASHPSGLACTNKGSNALRFQYSTTGTASYIERDHGSSVNPSKGQLYFYINAEGLGDGNTIRIISGVGTDYRAFDIFLMQTFTPSLILRFRHFSASFEYEIVDSDAISTGTWYRIAWEVVGGVPAKFWINTTQYTMGTNSRNNADTFARYYRIGTMVDFTGQTIDFYMDLIQVDDDTVPSACPQ